MTSEELAAILHGIASEANDGVLTPEAVVKRANDNKKGPLGQMFEWDDTKAAHAHRLDTARTLIRSVRFTNHVQHRGTVTVHVVNEPKYVHGPRVEHGCQGYVALSGIRRGGADSLAVLADEMARVTGTTNRALAIANRVGRKTIIDRLIALATEAQSIAEAVAVSEE
jgi:hypothetical protein